MAQKIALGQKGQLKQNKILVLHTRMSPCIKITTP